MKRLFVIFFSLFLMISIGCTKHELNLIHNKIIAVSIAPQETFVKAVSGDLVGVVTMLPPGASPTNYQPSPSQMSKLSQSDIYFSIGVGAEENILPKLKDFNENIEVVALDDEVAQVYSPREFEQDEHNVEHEHKEVEHSHQGTDPHIWMSPKRVVVMIETIRDELIELDPENIEIYKENATKYITELNKMDLEIKDILADIEKQSFIIFHPSLGYFADDYGLKMIAIEEEGKEASAKRIQQVIEFAENEKIKFVFYQEEFDSNQANTIAQEIGGTVIKVAPLSLNYLDNLKNIANKFKEVL